MIILYRIPISIKITILLVISYLIPHVSSANTELEEIKAQQQELVKLPLLDLFETELFSLSKKIQTVADSAAAVTVITNKEIKRSAATTLPEALRLIPGLQVTQSNAHTWSIGTRGFNDIYSNKLLVLIDGRSVYTPEFSGVFWDAQDTILEDIERIEVIRGSGGHDVGCKCGEWCD